MANVSPNVISKQTSKQKRKQTRWNLSVQHRHFLDFQHDNENTSSLAGIKSNYVLSIRVLRTNLIAHAAESDASQNASQPCRLKQGQKLPKSGKMFTPCMSDVLGTSEGESEMRAELAEEQRCCQVVQNARRPHETSAAPASPPTAACAMGSSNPAKLAGEVVNRAPARSPGGS